MRTMTYTQSRARYAQVLNDVVNDPEDGRGKAHEPVNTRKD
ncbi:hypothetical protein [Actinomyces qiguomingii]|nr:hypothetical protein [Actinomyces qiguomingii]